jgi:CRISPR-associated protein Cmr3
MVSVFLFRITEPILFRSSGEFSPQARGPFSFAKSLLLPTPSTIAGCLATLMGTFSGVSGRNWEEEVVNALALPDGAFLRGPYLIAGDEAYIPIEHGKTYGFLELSAIREFVKALLGSEEEKKQIWKTLTDRQSYVPMKDYTLEHLGIKLKSKEKTAEEGMIYLARFRDYLAAFEGKDVWVVMEAHNFQPDVEGVIKLGGEGRITRIERRDGGEIYKFVEEFKESHTSRCALVLVSHSLIEPLLNKSEKIDSGVYVYPALYSRIKELLPSGVCVRSIVGNACLLGAGFSIRENRTCRKPVYAALSPGTVIEIEYRSEHVNSIVSIYNQGLSVIGGKIGYGTFIPISLT